MYIPSPLSNAPQTNQCCTNYTALPILALIAGIALTIIGILAACYIPPFFVVSYYWYCFEIAAVVCFVISIVSFCCARRRIQPPHFQYLPQHLAQNPPPQVQQFQRHRHRTEPPQNQGTFYTPQHQQPQHPTQQIPLTQSAEQPQNRNPIPPQVILPPIQQTHTVATTNRPGLTEAELIFSQAENCMTKRDYVQAFHLYNSAWNKGFALAGCALAECYTSGIGCAKNDATALAVYQALANNHKCLEAAFYLAHYGFTTGDVQRGLEWYGYVITIDNDQLRVQALQRTLQHARQPLPAIDHNQFSSPETRAQALQISQKNQNEQRETQRVFLVGESHNYYKQEQSKRGPLVAQLMARAGA